MKSTTNYGLNKPELTDLPDITVLNPNFDKIDENLKSASDRLATAETTLTGKAPTNHASSETTHGIGTSSAYGHVKLSDAVTSTSSNTSGVSATPKAVKTAYDKAVEAKTAADNAQTSADTANTNATNAQKSADSKLPLSGGNVTGNLTVKSKHVARSVNGQVADANGNITVDVGGKVQSINGVEPDSSGNVLLDLGGDVQFVDGVEPDEEGNVALNASTREEILEAAKRVTDVEVDASVAVLENLQASVARVEANINISGRGIGRGGANIFYSVEKENGYAVPVSGILSVQADCTAKGLDIYSGNTLIYTQPYTSHWEEPSSSNANIMVDHYSATFSFPVNGGETIYIVTNGFSPTTGNRYNCRAFSGTLMQLVVI